MEAERSRWRIQAAEIGRRKIQGHPLNFETELTFELNESGLTYLMNMMFERSRKDRRPFYLSHNA